jgi:hypothetical protein
MRSSAVGGMRGTPQDRVRCRLGWVAHTATDRLDPRAGRRPAVVPDQGCAFQGDPQRYRAVTAARMVS